MLTNETLMTGEFHCDIEYKYYVIFLDMTPQDSNKAFG